MGGGGGVNIIYNRQHVYREPLLERGAFFRLQVYDLRVVKSVILILRRAEKG